VGRRTATVKEEPHAEAAAEVSDTEAAEESETRVRKKPRNKKTGEEEQVTSKTCPQQLVLGCRGETAPAPSLLGK